MDLAAGFLSMFTLFLAIFGFIDGFYMAAYGRRTSRSLGIGLLVLASISAYVFASSIASEIFRWGDVTMMGIVCILGALAGLGLATGVLLLGLIKA